MPLRPQNFRSINVHGGSSPLDGDAMSAVVRLAGAILESVQTQRQMATEKERQVRHEQDLEKDIAAEDDRFEHQVESAEIVTDPDEGQQRHDKQDPKRKKPKREDDEK